MPKFSASDIDVASFTASFDGSAKTKVVEMQHLLQYESQHFRCSVELKFCESVANHNWSVGLVQACDYIYLENRYGNSGSSFWDFHPLRCNHRKMVNDSDGRQYPFYNITSSKCEVHKGLVQDRVTTLHYEDHFYPTVAWQLPYCGGIRLTDVIRKQKFWVWLVAIKRSQQHDNLQFDIYNLQNDKLYVIGGLRWKYDMNMSFNPFNPVGYRLKFLHDNPATEPKLLDYNDAVPLSAFIPPHCNAAQSLIWYPKDRMESIKVLVPPRQVIVPWKTWVEEMVCYSQRQKGSNFVSNKLASSKYVSGTLREPTIQPWHQLNAVKVNDFIRHACRPQPNHSILTRFRMR